MTDENKPSPAIDSTIEQWTTGELARERVDAWRDSIKELLPTEDDAIVNRVWSNYNQSLAGFKNQIGTGLLDDNTRLRLEKERTDNGIIDMDGPAKEFLAKASRSSAFHAFGAFTVLSKRTAQVDDLVRRGQSSVLVNNTESKRKFAEGVAAAQTVSVLGFDLFSGAETIGRMQERALKSLNEILKLEQTLNQKAIVGAPESYWGQRANHSLVGLIISGLLLVGLVVATLVVAALQVEEFREIENQNTFILIKSSVTMVILFWLLLLVGRIFLGQLQLYSDAKERVVMVQTFLSLVHDRSVDALKDRDLVLRSLFKSGATGVFRDQGDTSAVVQMLNQVSGKSSS